MKMLMQTPFGFVMKMPGNSAYQRQTPYKLFINGKLHSCDSVNVVSVFGLSPASHYDIEITELSGQDALRFTHGTPNVEYVVNVRDYGATGDGVSEDTAAVNAAIYSAPPGAVLRFTKGVYIVGSIFLKSNVDLYLEAGAEIRQTSDRGKIALIKGLQKNYDHGDAIVNASWEGNPLDCHASLIYGRDVKNVRIYGAGVLDGGGEQGGWWNFPKRKNIAWRPRNLFLAYCENITVAGITSRNSAAWNFHPFYSDNLKFYGLNIESFPKSTDSNTDGLNPESCENVEIIGCRFHVGDDCIAIKSGKFYMSRRHYKPSADIRICHCLMEQGHGGVVIGSEISCGVRDVSVEHCLFRKTDRGLRIKSRRGRGDKSIISGISFKNVEMEDVAHCFTINMFYNRDPDGHSDYVRSKKPLPVSHETPVVGNIIISGVFAKRISGSAIFICGLPESKVQGVVVEKSEFSFLDNRATACPEMMDDEVLIPNLGIYMLNAEDVFLDENIFEGTYVEVRKEG